MKLLFIHLGVNCQTKLKPLCGIILYVFTMLVACNSVGVESNAIITNSTKTPAPYPITTLSASSTDQISPLPATTSITSSPTAPVADQLAAPQPLPSPPPPLPGWAWYQNSTFLYEIIYPQNWIVRGGYREGQMIFSSPETNSEIRIDVWNISPETNWLEWVQSDPARLALSLPAESITTNVTFLGQPAFFHFQPSAGGGAGDMATLTFGDGSHVFHLSYHSGVIPAFKAEAMIYQAMLSSFTRPGIPVNTFSLPNDWTTGEALVIWRDRSEPAKVSAGESATYQTEFQGVIDNFDPGTFVLLGDDGATYDFDTSAYFFQGQNKDLVTVNHTDADIQEGDRVLIKGYPLASGRIRPQYLAIEREKSWQPYAYQSFFNLGLERLDPALVSYYPLSETTNLWLFGTSEQVLPYLVDEAGSSFELKDFSFTSTQNLLAHGTLQTPNNPKVLVKELYFLQGECRVVAEFEKDCFPWQQIYPPVPETIITATVSSVFPESNTIILEQPSQGFISLSLAPKGQLLKGEVVASWEDFVPGTTIEADGEPGTGGVLLVQKVDILSKRD